MNKRKRMIVKAKTQMIINADTLEESGWYRRMMGEKWSRVQTGRADSQGA